MLDFYNFREVGRALSDAIEYGELGADAKPMLEVRDVWKSFSGVMALRGVSIGGHPREVHCIVGENGAGKSTLMRIVGGVYPPDRGSVRLNGEKVLAGGPQKARSMGVAIAYQETSLVPDLDVAHNIWLGHEPSGRGGLIDHEELYGRSRELLAYVGLDMDPRISARVLSVAQRELVEVSKALSNEPSILILDEPTAALAPRDVGRLFAVLRELREKGLCVIFISHRIPEVLEIADRITVLKDGEVAGELPAAGTSERDVVQLMVGRAPEVVYPARRTPIGDGNALEVKGLCARGSFRDVSFGVRKGEVLGIAGMEGSGQRDLARCLFGLVRREAGKVRVNGRPVEIHSPADAISAGIAYVTNDRRGEGLALILPVGENLTLPILPKLSRAGVLDVRREAEVATQLVDRLSIRTPALAQPVEFLSGGNQQKVSVGRWLKAEPSILIVDEPTVGVDVGAKVELYEMIRELAAEGMAIIMLSADSRELLGLCDRIIVVADGRIVSEQIVAEASEESLVRAAVTASRSQEAPGLPQKIAVTTRETDGVDRHPRRAAFFTRWTPSLLLVVLLTCLALYTTLRSPYFLTAMNLSSLGFQWAPIALAAFGQTLVLLVAGVDMSIGPVVSLITTELSYLLVSGSGASFAVSLAVALATGLAVGLLNGLLIRYLKIPDLIVTLAMYFSIMGVALLVRPAPGGVVAASFMDALTYQLGPVPVAVVLVVALCIAGDIILTRTRVGAYIYATGSARGAAYESGVPVARVRLTVYIIAGLSACVAGLLVTAQIGSGDPSVGTNYTLESVMAAVVGGASLFGGRGTLIGAMLGALLIAGVQNFLELLGVSSYYLYVWTGGLTLLAVALYSTDYLPRLVRILLGLFVRRSEGGLAEGGLESR